MNVFYDSDYWLSTLKVSEKRYRHTRGTRDCALWLASVHYPGIETDKLASAAALHDMTKEFSAEQHYAICEKYGIGLSDIERRSHKLLHGITASAIAKYKYDFDEEACNAIRYHTTARVNMTPYEKIVFLADYIEETRTDDECVGVRKKHSELLEKHGAVVSLDKTIVYALSVTIKRLSEELKLIHPNTFEARNFLLLKE